MLCVVRLCLTHQDLLGVGFVVPQGYIAQAADALDSAVVQKFATGLCRFLLKTSIASNRRRTELRALLFKASYCCKGISAGNIFDTTPPVRLISRNPHQNFKLTGYHSQVFTFGASSDRKRQTPNARASKAESSLGNPV